MLKRNHFSKLILLSVFFVNAALADTFIIYYEAKSSENPEAHSQHCDRAIDSIIEHVKAETYKSPSEDNSIHITVNGRATSIRLSSYQDNSTAINQYIKYASCTDELDFQSRTSKFFADVPPKNNASVYVITPDLTNEISETMADLSNSYDLQASVVYIEEPLLGTSLHAVSKVKLVPSKTLSMTEVIRLPQAFSKVSAEPTATESPAATSASPGNLPVFISKEEELDKFKQITLLKFIEPLVQLEVHMSQLEFSLSVLLINELQPKDSISRTMEAAKVLKHLHRKLSQLNSSLSSTKEAFMSFTDNAAFANSADDSVSTLEHKLYDTERLLVNTGHRLSDAIELYDTLYASFLKSVQLTTTDNESFKNSLNAELGPVGFNLISHKTLFYLGEDLNSYTIENHPTIKPDYQKIPSNSVMNMLTTNTKSNTPGQMISLNGVVKSRGGSFVILIKNGTFIRVTKETLDKSFGLQGYSWKQYTSGYIIFSSTLNEVYFISNSTVLEIKKRLSAGERAQSGVKSFGSLAMLIYAGAGAAVLDLVSSPQILGLQGKEAELFQLTQRNIDIMLPHVVSNFEKAAGHKDFIQAPDKVFPAIADIASQMQ